ncbi:MAG: hypothetical protein Q9163_000974 [Psora crenata]
MQNEQTILNHYNLTNAYPNSWPTEKDDSDDSQGERTKALSRHGIRRSKSKFSALERHGSDRNRSLVPGSEKLPQGQDNLVQTDEPDPLGASDSVVRILRQKGLPVDEDSRLRHRFLLSSTTFSPNLYLSQIHAHASNQDLLQGLETLSRSIDSKSASLKVLVESNFERFVRAKSTIDNVYAEMRNQGAEVDKERGHSRVASRESKHFRSISGQQGHMSPGKAIHKAPRSEKRKNALIKESDYGVAGIRAPLMEVAVKAEEIWGPALGGRVREGSLKQILESVENGREIFRVNKAVAECIRRKDYDALVEEYSKARKHAEEAKEIAEKAYQNQQQLTDDQVNRIVLIGRMWSEVDKRIEELKRDVWRKLTNIPMNPQSSVGRQDPDEHMPLISVLLEIGVEDNPIWVWLLSRYDYLKNKISATFERSRVEIEVLRRRLANGEAPPTSVTAGYIKDSAGKHVNEKIRKLDTPQVLELWNLIHETLNHMLSTKNGILGEVIEFWDKVKTFMDGKVQKTLPVGINGQSRKHHHLSADGVRDLQNGVVELIGMLQDYVFSFFADPPIEDISLLYSPSPATSAIPLSPYAHQDARFRLDDNNPPPPSPKRGEAWEEFAFWPPYANSLGGAHYLGTFLTLLGSAASEMVAMSPVASGQALPDKSRTMFAGVRERSLRAASAAWSKDAEACKYLEDWSRTSEHQDLTNLPARFSVFETTILTGMQKILYVPEAANTRSGSASIVSPPPTKLVQMVKSQFVTSLYKALSGMVENAERSTPLGSINSFPTLEESKEEDGGTDVNSRLVQTETIPHLISQFEMNFSITLTDESKQLRDALTQISDRLFLSYTRPTASKLSDIVHLGILDPGWVPTTSRPSEVRPYVYEALLLLVYAHTEVSTTTPGQLTNQVLSHLLEQMFEAFLESFKRRDKYYLPALMQATLDIEFIAQTLSQYTTKKASEIQSQIYVVLDEKTTPEASKSLQGELPEMRTVLKKLREGTRTQFLAFRRERGRAVSRAE